LHRGDGGVRAGVVADDRLGAQLDGGIKGFLLLDDVIVVLDDLGLVSELRGLGAAARPPS
jgi:hypothetical protein